MIRVFESILYALYRGTATHYLCRITRPAEQRSKSSLDLLPGLEHAEILILGLDSIGAGVYNTNMFWNELFFLFKR